jgi:hypothetical protein
MVLVLHVPKWEALVNKVVLVIALTALPVQVGAQTIQLIGKAGFLNEWQLSGDTVAQVSNGKKEYSGLVTIKHIGLCTHDGPDVRTGEIRFQMVGPESQIRGTIFFDGRECTYTGRLSASYFGVMDCPGAHGVPLTLWSK